jgi:hydroxyacylglutathione hydrolase
MTNSYLLAWGNEAIVIDVPELPDVLIELVDKEKLHITAILLTHGHFDHVLGVGQLQQTYPGTPCFINTKDIFLLEQAISTARHFLEYEPVALPIEALYSVAEWRTSLAEVEIRELPGHTPGSVGYYFPKEESLFVGDLMGRSSIGTYSHTYSSKQDMAASLNEVLNLPHQVTVYPGHGEATTIEDESTFLKERIAYLEFSGAL